MQSEQRRWQPPYKEKLDAALFSSFIIQSDVDRNDLNLINVFVRKRFHNQQELFPDRI